MNRARGIITAVILGFMILAFAGRLFFPLESRVILRHVGLYFKGVHEFHAGAYTGLLKDFCDENNPEARGCTCIALLHGLGDDVTTWSKILGASRGAWKKPVRLYALRIPKNSAFKPGDSPEDYRVRLQAGEIARALSPVCPSWVIVGNSLGGWEAAWIAIEGKLKVSHLVLVDAAGTRSSDNPVSVNFFAHPSGENLREFLKRIFYKPPRLSNRALNRGAEIMTQEKLGEILAAQTPGDFLDGKLRDIHVPTLVFWGANDQLIPDQVGKELSSKISGSVFKEAGECGHIPQKECPEPLIDALNGLL